MYEDNSELLLSLINQGNNDVYIESIKIIFKDTTDKKIYSKNVLVDRNLDKNQVYDLTVKCAKRLPEISTFEFEIRAK